MNVWTAHLFRIFFRLTGVFSTPYPVDLLYVVLPAAVAVVDKFRGLAINTAMTIYRTGANSINVGTCCRAGESIHF